MKKVHQVRNASYDSAINKVFEGKTLTKFEAETLAIRAVMEWGAMPGQIGEQDFPSVYGYVPGVDAAALGDNRRPDWGDIEPSQVDVENHEKVVTHANIFYWSLREKYFG